MTLFLKKPRPQTDFYLSLFGIVECFVQFVFYALFTYEKNVNSF